MKFLYNSVFCLYYFNYFFSLFLVIANTYSCIITSAQNNMMSSFLKNSYSQNNNTLSKEFQNERLSDIILDRSDWTNPSTGERYKLDISINQAWQNGIELNKTF